MNIYYDFVSKSYTESVETLNTRWVCVRLTLNSENYTSFLRRIGYKYVPKQTAIRA